MFESKSSLRMKAFNKPNIFFLVSKKDTTPSVEAASADSEVALDPFAEESKDKKASLLALVRGDSTVAQALEEERINDIYFTSEFLSNTQKGES